MRHFSLRNAGPPRDHRLHRLCHSAAVRRHAGQLDALGYASMTPIQAQSLPVILKGQDLIAQAKTGSGKTAAFGIGLLNPINPRYFGCQATVLCPTRELADRWPGAASPGPCRRQHQDPHPVRRRFAGPADRLPEHGAHIIVGTPGRIQQHGQGHFGARWAQYPGAG